MKFLENMTVEELQRVGIQVHISHHRMTRGRKPHTHGGTTVVSLQFQGSNQQYTGVARCCPTDQFNSKVGVSIALGRAVAKYQARPKQLAEGFVGAVAAALGMPQFPRRVHSENN